MEQDLIINDAYLPLLEDYSRTQIIYGGSASGKSWALSQRVVVDLIAGGRNYLICRQVARTIRASVFMQVKRVIDELGISNRFKINKDDATITYKKNGCMAFFAGLDDVEKLKSIVPPTGVITDIWIEEATETEKNDVMNLYKRQRGGDEATRKRMILSFNPILQSHWIYQEFFAGVAWSDEQKEYKSDDLSILKTTYKDNKFLTTQDIRDLENEKDKYRYNVYTLGNWGILGHVIFTNWRVDDLLEMTAQFTNHRNGGDFGFSVDPSAVWQAHLCFW
jgi:phage terminase large subunit